MKLQSLGGGRGLWGPGPASSPAPRLGALCSIARADEGVHDLLRPPCHWGPPPRMNGKIFLLALAPCCFGSFPGHMDQVLADDRFEILNLAREGQELGGFRCQSVVKTYNALNLCCACAGHPLFLCYDSPLSCFS